MSETAGRSVIHDLGYRPYTGPRIGPAGIARALVVTGLRNSFGLGRSGKSKVLPFILLGLNVLPAVIVGGVMVLVGLDELPIGYAAYASSTQVLLGIFVAAQAPVLFSRDLRHGSISLYLARPLGARTYALARWAALLAATFVFLMVPILVLYAVALLGELSFVEQTREAAVATGLALMLALSLTGVSGVIAAWSTRRGFAVVATMAVLLLGNGLVSAVQSIAVEEGEPTVAEVAGLLSPYSLYRGLSGAWADASVTAEPSSAGMEAAYVVTFLALSGACVAGLLWRYRKLAGT